MTKVMYWIVISVLTIGAIFGLVNEIIDPESQYDRYLAQYTHLYTENVKGGETPQETLELFITALESGDIDDAVLYIEPEQRQYYEEDLRAGYENGNLRIYIDDLKRIDYGVSLESTGRYEFGSPNPETGNRFSYFLVYNDLANIWMFESI